MEIERTEHYKGFSIDIAYADWDENPRTLEESHMATLVCKHSRYILGDNVENKARLLESLSSLREFLAEKEREFGCELVLGSNLIIIPLYLYDHSGICLQYCQDTIKTLGELGGGSRGWDTSAIGFAYSILPEVQKRIRPDITYNEVLAEVLIELEEYDSYIRGDTYTYCIPEGEDLFSCTYYGYDLEKNGLLESARYEIDATINRNATEVHALVRCLQEFDMTNADANAKSLFVEKINALIDITTTPIKVLLDSKGVFLVILEGSNPPKLMDLVNCTKPEWVLFINDLIYNKIFSRLNPFIKEKFEELLQEGPKNEEICIAL